MSLKDEMYDVFILLICTTNIDSMSEAEVIEYYESLLNTYPCSKCTKINRYKPFLSLQEHKKICESFGCPYFKVLLGEPTFALFKILRKYFENTDPQILENLSSEAEKQRTDLMLLILNN